jgi:hypothetical protein
MRSFVARVVPVAAVAEHAGMAVACAVCFRHSALYSHLNSASTPSDYTPNPDASTLGVLLILPHHTADAY